MDVTVDEQVQLLEPAWRAPAVEWLQVDGVAGLDDFGVDGDADLVVSDDALTLLRQFNIDDCEVHPRPKPMQPS